MEAPILSTLHVRLTASLKGESCTRFTTQQLSTLTVKTFFEAWNSQ
jgi:hypothetical protein